MPLELGQLHILGESISGKLATGALAEIQEMMDAYLAGLDAQFGGLKQHSVSMLDGEQKQLLQQFQVLLKQVEYERSQTESELRGLSKAGRAAELYKKNAG